MVRILELCAVDFTAYHLLRPLGVALREAGYEVTFCCSPGEGLDLLEGEGFQTATIPIARSYNIYRHIVSFVRLTRLLRHERFDVIHAHTPVAGLIGRVAARLVGIPMVVYTAHGFYFHEGMSKLVHRFFVMLERFGAMLSDLIFVQSEEDWMEAVRENVATAEKLVHIGNGVDPTLFGSDVIGERADRLRREIGLKEGPVVGFVGRIVREKGALEFVRAAASVKSSFPEATFIMVGSPLKSDRDVCWEEVHRLRDDLGLTGVLHLTGYRQDVPVFLSLFDCFVLPSYREGMPRALLEAMAAGLPIVATNIRGCREEVVDGATGILVPPRNEHLLADAIMRLLHDREMASSMGQAGRNRVLEQFDERKIVGLQVEWLGRLIGEKFQK